MSLLSARPKSMPAMSQSTTSANTGRRKTSRTTTPTKVPAETGESTALSPSRHMRTEVQERRELIVSFEALSHNHYFNANHIHYTCKDPQLGAIHCLLSLQDNRIAAHVLSRAGSMSFCDLEQRPRKACVQLPAHLIHCAEYQALVSVMLEYLSRVSSLHSKAYLTLDWSDASVARLVGSMEVIKGASALSTFKEFLTPKCSRSITVDVIASEDSEIISLLPEPTTVKDKDIEISKFPQAAECENVEKKDNLIHEILATERTYVTRLQHLLKDYAVPLRAAARRDRPILGVYETNNMFPSTLDAIVLLNQDFLRTLEASSGEYELALTLANGFRDFAKVYARYLETSSDLDSILRESMKNPKFKDFTDSVRASANAAIGIRELVMEPISRIPRYSLLITSLLAALTTSNPAYPIFREALTAVRRIGYMERDKKEMSQEVIMKLSSLVSSWPSQLVKSSTRVIGYIDCLDVLPPYGNGSSAPGGHDGIPCSLVLFSDGVVILKRGHGIRIEEILQSSRKGELGYRGYAMLDAVRIVEGDDCMHLLLTTEICAVNSERWLNRPVRRFALMSSDASRFSKQVHDAQFQLKTCHRGTRVDNFDRFQIRYALYSGAEWDVEQPQRRCPVRIWDSVDDGSETGYNLILLKEEGQDSWSCKLRCGSFISLVCRAVSKSSLRDLLCHKIVQLQTESWLSLAALDESALMTILGSFSASISTQKASGSSPSKSRPTSPSKIMSSFLGRKERESPSRPGTAATLTRPTTAVEVATSATSHTILKKKSNQLFNFGGNEDRSLLGVEAFVNSLLSFDRFLLADFMPTSSAETKQVNSLVSLISKDPKKTFAIMGSPAKVALFALKGFCKSTLSKKLAINVVLPDAVCLSLAAHAKQDPESRASRSKAIIMALPAHNNQSLRAILRLGNHLLLTVERSARIKCLLLLSEILVSPMNATRFIDTLEFLIQYFNTIFPSRFVDVGTTSSITSGMSLQPPNSRFGSISSHSHSHYTSETGSSSSPLRSPAKESSFGGTPDLVYGTGATDDGQSLTRTRSDVSVDHEEDDVRYKRSTIHVDQRYDKNNIFGLNLSGNILQDRLSCSLRGGGDFQAARKPVPGDTVRDLSPARSEVPELDGPTMQHNGRATYEEVPDVISSEGRPKTLDMPVSRRVVTPSKLPLPSPKVSSSRTFPSPQSRSESTLDTPPVISQVLSSKKGSSIPRLPSTLVKRRGSQGLTKSFSNHSFTFDAETSQCLDLALKYSMSESFEDLEAIPKNVAPASSLRRSDSTVDKSLEERQRRMSREYLKRELASDSRIASSSTIRRISRQLQETEIGPLEMPLPAIPAVWQSAYERPNSRPSPVMELLSPKNATETETFNGCTLECKERYEMLRLELQHYKNLYRSSVEEIDMTLDIANEQIADLQSALDKGTLEATALAMLELEKEKNRKLVVQIGELRGEAGISPI